MKRIYKRLKLKKESSYFRRKYSYKEYLCTACEIPQYLEFYFLEINSKEIGLYVQITYFCTYKLLVMETKLTLKLNKKIIERAKEYASEKKISLSKVVETYLQSLTSEKKTDEFEISPFVKSLATGVKISPDLDYKKEYGEYLMKKYK